MGTKYAVLTSSGTSAIFLCLKALGIGLHYSVLVPSLTAFPTVEPIFHVGARHVFGDIDDTFCMNVRSADASAVIAVHLYGHPANMDGVKKLGCKFIIEDCCQAHGATYRGKRVGSIGIAGCFSFYPSKNLTVLGDGGMITT